MTAGVDLNGQINVFKSLSPVLSQVVPGVLVWVLRGCIGSLSGGLWWLAVVYAGLSYSYNRLLLLPCLVQGSIFRCIVTLFKSGGVHDRLHIYPLCGIFYFPWHRQQIEGTDGF